MISDCNLNDIGYFGCPFTWYRANLWQRLDRFLFNDSWLVDFSFSSVEHLSRTLSDHSPLLLSVKTNLHLNALSFRFQNMWMLHNDFSNILAANWQEECYWHQKSNAKFLVEGDRNTKFFHALANKKKSKSFIHKIIDTDGSVLDTDVEICNSGVDYFKNIFTNSTTCIPLTDSAIISRIICEEDNLLLCQTPSEEEIVNVIKNLNSNAVAGPDGFTTKFFQDNWETIKEDVINAVKDFFAGNPNPKFFSSTYIVLIPKIDGPNHWHDFRPISLCTFLNKLNSKIIANRLINILPRIISLNQTGYVKGRSIFDNILLAQEITHDINVKSKGGNVIFKLDISKAYENLNWNFLYKILSLFGFGNSFISIIKNSIENCFFSVIINGKHNGFFKSVKGIRQGDTMSPALFIIAMEYLSRGLNDLFLRNPRLNFRTIRGFPISHLSFADDFILFTNGSINNISLLLDFLFNFHTHSGLSINKEKSTFIVSKSINQTKIHSIQRLCGFVPKALPITYLGTPIYKGKKRSFLFDNIFTKIEKKMNNWSSNFLSYGGRLILIKSVLNSMPIYLFHTLLPSISVCSKLERIFNKFFWGSTFNNKSIHWSSWDKNCGTLSEGGLGCKSLMDSSKAFSYKL
ncbi:Putative ribonuclease H protein [Dendrobium catenatum]|uniref:Ribonuclease H protein n=1 Tax=Dendrobium catenatum TaxID=906689 RepID=A0A2I0XIG8_9ASPA|nr:Putative ribonuclease H protein [Dendrobium catenatum]